MNADERFFHANAGYSHDPKTETRAQGRRRTARALAKAESEAVERDWRYEWEWEESWSCGDLGCDREDAHEHEVLCCVLRNSKGEVLSSLGMIEMSLNGRVVEAELADEALHELADAIMEVI